MLWVDGSEALRFLFADRIHRPPSEIFQIIHPADGGFLPREGWEDLVVGRQPVWVQEQSYTMIETLATVRDPIPDELFENDFHLAIFQKLGGVLRAHVCGARVLRVQLEYVADGASGQIRFAVAGVRQLPDEVVRARAA